MNLNKALSKRAVCLDLQSTTKDGVIEEMVNLMESAGLLKDRSAALAAILEREKQMSTGMQYGIAIPHGRSDTTECLIAAVGIHRSGIDFEAIDDEPSTLFIMTLSPSNRSGPQLQFLAEISRLLTDTSVRDQIRQAETAEEVISLLKA